MAVPDFQSLMNPVLNLYEKKNVELRPRDIEDEIAELFNLSEEDKNQMIPSNIETILRNRVNWAVYYLFRAGLLDRPKRGYYKISEAGVQENKTGNKINIGYLKKFPSFVDFSNIECIDVEQRVFSQRHLLNGDLIVEKSGGSDKNPVGRAVLYEGTNGVFSYSNFTMVLRIIHREVILSKFLYYYILANYQAGVMNSMQTQTTGLHNLILDKYLTMPLYLPPRQEQERIINKIEILFSKLDTIMESL